MCVLVYRMPVTPKTYYLIGGENNNLNCPMLFRRRHFYSHLELFNYLFFALLAKFFPKPQMSVPTHLLLCFLLTPCRLHGFYFSSNWIISLRKEFKNLLPIPLSSLNLFPTQYIAFVNSYYLYFNFQFWAIEICVGLGLAFENSQNISNFLSNNNLK